jgi:hypothetical protein
VKEYDRASSQERQVEPSHYWERSYNTKGRFVSYWHQIDNIVRLAPESTLEVGIGSGLVANHLNGMGLSVVTVDVDERLCPDTVGSVVHLPFPTGSFDVCACYEVLEHLPYDFFGEALGELRRVSTSHVLLSLPDLSRVCRVSIKVSNVGGLGRLVPLPRLRPLERGFDGQHHWNIGTSGYPLRRVISDIERTGLEVTRTYRILEIPWHRFLVLRRFS